MAQKIDRRGSPQPGATPEASNDHSEDEELCEMVALSPAGRCATMCIFGCISLMGCRSSVVRRLSFYPPFPAGYSLQGDQLYIQEAFHGASGGRGFRAAGTEQLVQRPPPREGQESIQKLLLRSRLPEQVIVCRIPRGRKKHLAAVLLLTAPAPEAAAAAAAAAAAGGGSASQGDNDAQSIAQRLSSKQLIIFSHGNSTDIGHMCQVNVLAYDYSGYGWSDGKATEAALYADIRRVVAFAVNELKVPPYKIILYGHSVGSGPSCDFVSKRKQKPLGGIILHSSIASGLRLFINNIDKAPWFDAFQNAEKLKKVHDVPMLLIHGRLDRQVPFSHSLKLEASCREADARFEQQQQQASRSRCWLGPFLLSPRSEPPEERAAELQRHRVQTWWVPDADHNDVEHKAGPVSAVRFIAFRKGYRVHGRDWKGWLRGEEARKAQESAYV
ncbi:hypothetical protein, conserved [Eimeria maxima]|uniref:Serine aminopeptidase S33 domain-containing protein n=1 Tax=Eimeria maxima TaxID=5804 RepID=U6MC55_EIMMA|nr:hypothetical protein, conserved [Eimeria maxima]CDJ59255.1 hypothetical protein, conserved [Eimeria maxima]